MSSTKDVLLEECTIVLPALVAHCITAGIQIAHNESVDGAILPCAMNMTEWAELLYGWHHKFCQKLKEDVRALGCRPAAVLVAPWH